MTQAFRRFTERPDAPYRLGRHQVHDALPMELEWLDDHLTPIKTVMHVELQPCFNQGDIGDCTMNAAVGLLVCEPFAKPGRTFEQPFIVSLYSRETQIDDSQIPGHYPPEDTGSTGPWSMRVLMQQQLIRSFKHTRRLATMLRMLQHGPVSFGTPWYESMFTPDAKHRIVVDPKSGVAGGHQVCVVGVDAEAETVRIRNSWGSSWGDQGHADLSWSDLKFLFGQGADVVQPIV